MEAYTSATTQLTVLQLVRRGVLKTDPLTIIPTRTFLKKNSSVQPSKEEEACQCQGEEANSIILCCAILRRIDKIGRDTRWRRQSR